MSYPSLQTKSLPNPQVLDIPISPTLKTSLEPYFNPIQTTYPGMLRFTKSMKNSNLLRFDNMWHLDSFKSDDQIPKRSGLFSGSVRRMKDGVLTNDIQDVTGYCKITHVLDAYRMIQGHYPLPQHPALPASSRKSAKVFSKLHDPHNQAYVDAVACYMLSKLREANHSPHFSMFYGSYMAIAKEYYYNITEDFSDLRFESWFWKKQGANKTNPVFRLVAFDEDVLLDANDPLMLPPDDIPDTDSSESSDSSMDSSENISEIHSDTVLSESPASLRSASISTSSVNLDDLDESDTDSDISNDIKIFAVIPEFPTMLIFLEANTNTMDSLLEEEDDGLRGTPEWEQQWSAWIFQVIAALCQIQNLWAMTHNDLHSNNILWVATDLPFLYYKTEDGRAWKVPTFGKIFRIIDFGRAIYTHNGVLCISDDYLHENEAGGQYNFGPIYDPSLPRCYPNPSFDLCRLAVSILESLFHTIPDIKPEGDLLSCETDRVQNETVSDLFNVIWSWLIDEDGRNVLWNSDDSERYPGFNLYRTIAHKVKHAVPRDQIDKLPFKNYRVEQIPDNQKVYSLFF